MSEEDDEMKLPEGKTCSDCYHCERCTSIFGVTATNIVCDFCPSRFLELANPDEQEGK